jgi:uncharacterized protein (DUF58 family)
MAYFPYLPAKGEASADLQLNFQRRGRYHEDSFGVATRFPFAFLTKTRHVALQRDVLVYPRIEPTDKMFEILPLVRGEWESFLRGRGSDLYLIREYMPEDSARHVDWKATAKSGSLKVREFSREDERKVCVVFDNPEAGVISVEAYDRAVNLAASLAWHFSEQNAEVSFLLPGHGRSSDIHEFLARLAVIDFHNSGRVGKGTAVQKDVMQEIESSSSGEYNIVITARSRENLPAALWGRSYFVLLGDEAISKSTALK